MKKMYCDKCGDEAYIGKVVQIIESTVVGSLVHMPDNVIEICYPCYMKLKVELQGLLKKE